MDTDRPALEIEVEVTPEMARVGARIIADRYEDRLDWMTEELATEVYRSMREIEPATPLAR